MKKPDYQSALGFELVTLPWEPNAVQTHVIREDGADDREASITELVLWRSLGEALEALDAAETILRYAPDINTNVLGTRQSATTGSALAAVRAALKSCGVAQ